MLLKYYSEDQIKNLIGIIKDCVRENRYTITLENNKLENIQFMQEYNINEKMFSFRRSDKANTMSKTEWACLKVLNGIISVRDY